jgi:broad specificity phosphatase PhoE
MRFSRLIFVEAAAAVIMQGTTAFSQKQHFSSGSLRRSRPVMSQSNHENERDKKIVFIRHGCTHMNEYLASNPWGSPGFTDIFENDELFRDSPLSQLGVKQAQALSSRLTDSSCPEYGKLLGELELIVTSPLIRAIQTLEIGLLPHIVTNNESDQSEIPIMAVPLAAERLYLISDVGKRRQDLHGQFGHVIDFYHDGFHHEEWWFQPNGSDAYSEWRPRSSNQRYACPGEPDQEFAMRMIKLYQWLDERPESTIAVVSHWGVIDWFLDADFDNCEMRAVSITDIATKVKQYTKAGADA